MSNATRVEFFKTPITFDEFMTNEFQKEGTVSAQLRQVVTTKSFYPSKKVENELNGGLFSAKDFGFEEQEFTSTEERVCWVPAPVGTTEEQLQKMLDGANKAGACVYRVLSSQPILSEDQKWSIDTGRKTKDDYANQQALRYPENEETLEEGTAGKLILDSFGNPQYRKTFYWGTPKEDQDFRNPKDFYISGDMQDELITDSGTFADQQID